MPKARFLPVLSVGRSDYGRCWEIVVLGKVLVRLIYPCGNVSRMKWSYQYRRSPWYEWPWIEFRPSNTQWVLYVFNFVWVYRKSRKQ